MKMTSAPALAWVRAHPILAGALACALVGTFHAEYTLATSTNVNKWVALAVPGALDLYVIQALRVHRDVAAAVLAMVAANITSHLIVAGLYPTDVRWQVGVTAAVGAVAPGIVWRVHSLERTRTRAELLWGLKAGAADQFYSGAVRTPECTAPEPAPAPMLIPETGPDIAPAMNYQWSAPHPSVPDAVPAEWSAAEYGDPDAPVPYLAAVPDLPEEHLASAVHSESPLNAGDWDYLPEAQKYVNSTDKPSVRGLRRVLRVGQDRAERLLTHLGVIL